MPSAASSTRARILDASATLFQSLGIGATSIRAIIREAGVNLNAIHYHFGSKEGVTGEVFRRIMEPINRERHELLDRLEAQGPTVATLLHAVYWPLIRRCARSPRSADLRGLMIANQLRHDPSPEAGRILAENEAAFAPRFERLLEAATGLTERELRLTIRVINAAAWGLATQPALLNGLTRAADRAAGVQALFDDFLRFATAGLESLMMRSGRKASPRVPDETTTGDRG